MSSNQRRVIYIADRSNSNSISGPKGPRGVTGYTGFQGAVGVEIEGFQGYVGLPGPTCHCYLDGDLMDVEVTGATGGEILKFDGATGGTGEVWRNYTPKLNQIEFSNIPEFSNEGTAYDTLGAGKLWKKSEDLRIRVSKINLLSDLQWHVTLDDADVSGSTVIDTCGNHNGTIVGGVSYRIMTKAISATWYGEGDCDQGLLKWSKESVNYPPYYPYKGKWLKAKV